MAQQFNYKEASAEEIAQHFLVSSRQVVSHARRYYRDDAGMHSKITQAYKLYVLAKIDKKGV
jgi:metal-dependent HD superfamily phosphatase/phosphodiesterase